MEYKELIKLGEIIEIRDGDIKVCTKIQEIISDTEFTVLQPTVKGAPLRAEDRNVEVVFYRESGCFSFNAQLLPQFRKGAVMFCPMVRVSEIKRTQRRNYYRMPIVLDTFLYKLDEEGNPDKKHSKGKTVNLSERSVELTSFTSYEKGTPMEVKIEFSDDETALLKAKVFRCSEPLQPTYPYQIVLKFDDNDIRDKAFLRRFIFKQQKLLCKKIRKEQTNSFK